MERLERSLRLYALYVPLGRAHFWAPIFFLYFAQRFSIGDVLRLEALYYLSVVCLEVPSGFFSDRVGRVATLRISSAAGAVACGLFLMGGDSFAMFAAAQLAIAVSFSFTSGTDTAYHYDTLSAAGRGATYETREAHLHRNALLVAATSALIGGAAGVFDLRIAYALSLGAALLQVGVTWGLAEPPRDTAAHRARGFAAQVRECAAHLGRPVLAWLFAYVVFQTTLEHLPYEFAQPYVAAVVGETTEQVRRTPLVTGVVTAAIAGVGALAAAASPRLRARLGTTGALLFVTGLQVITLSAMSVAIHWMVLPLIALRSVHPAVSTVLVRAEVTPRLSQALRATYLSLQSLAGRLGYAGVLFGLGALAGSRGPADPETVLGLLRICAVAALVGTLALVATRGIARRGGAS